MVRRALIWGTCFAALCVIVRGYVLRDPDSMLYEWIARTLESRPLREWIAPRFPVGWPTQSNPYESGQPSGSNNNAGTGTDEVVILHLSPR